MGRVVGWAGMGMGEAGEEGEAEAETRSTGHAIRHLPSAHYGIPASRRLHAVM